ncbi:LVIVD repeat-containing protein [Actinokineospora alba]|uniref:LVIVD repeat-containing protein n=1 Tax=Actinokineospora alba TaxID=504798 RepID=A0A1H0W6A6_9PSEU|nr:LVIVD repeat-containing protein [Actinokineospora alba]SDJ49522.1 LVIVD repeat-containing protein [Actinokineospora alba]SDP86257.1 LVIVD repeat-containing protein [Actinokineospora alba]
MRDPRRSRARQTGLLGAAVLVASVLTTGVSSAHPDHPGGGREDFPGEGVADGMYKQHDGDEGHLPPVNNNVTLVGKGEVTNPAGTGNTGRVADVTAHGDYAYLTAFREPTCLQTGVHVMDISDPANPTEVLDAFIPTSAGSYAGEGIQVHHVANAFFTGDLLAHQNETCPGVTPPPPNLGGISLWDVTDPRDPKPVALHAGDFSNPSGATDPAPNQTHSMRMWTNEFDGRTYVVLVDDEELTDVDIMDITDPFHPVMVNDQLDLVHLFGVDQPTPDNLTSRFSHDMMVTKIGQRYVMNMNYWDGGYVLLDVTDPRPGKVSLIAESDYAQLDEERLARGHSISPEGNAHQSELSPNNKFMIGTDEDFNPFRVTATIDSGPYAGQSYIATQASDTPPIDQDTTISGPTTYVGDACATLPAGTGTAIAERGTCSFQIKLDNITAAGYSAGIVFQNVRADCLAGVTMLASGTTIPYVFVNRLNGLKLLGVPGVTEANACTTASPATGPGESTTIQAVFDGWGYVRLFSTNIPHKAGGTGGINQLDTYSVPEAQDVAYATGFGDLSVHEVAMDPDNSNLAYISYYAAGFRVVNYGKNGIQEVGAFIDEGGNNFWGVEVWKDENGVKYILGSDRDFGLYVFQYNG